MVIWTRDAAQETEWLDAGCTVKVASMGLANIVDVT